MCLPGKYLLQILLNLLQALSPGVGNHWLGEYLDQLQESGYTHNKTEYQNKELFLYMQYGLERIETKK